MSEGKAKSAMPEFSIWNSMIQRCANPRNNSYDRYGGRGISVCAEWVASFDAFIADMGPRPTSNHSIDRIDNGGDYEPGNCRWATIFEQANNRRNNIELTVGDETHTLGEWARLRGIRYDTIFSRVKRGWCAEDVIKTPLEMVGSNNPQSKLTERDVRKIKKLIPSMTQQKIADMFGVSNTTIHQIKHGRKWGHVS